MNKQEPLQPTNTTPKKPNITPEETTSLKTNDHAEKPTPEEQNETLQNNLPSEDPFVSISRLENELQAAKDQALRSQAELQNSLRRQQQEIERARRFSVEPILRDLLPVLDSMDRALDLPLEQKEKMGELYNGVEMLAKMLFENLQKHGVSLIVPEKHSQYSVESMMAVSTVETSEVAPNMIVNVLQKGYFLHDRILRPAMVVVAKEPTQK